MHRLALFALTLAACGPAAGSDETKLAVEPSSASPLASRLEFPVACEPGATCELQNYVDRDSGPGAADYLCQGRTYDGHNGVDIRLPDLVAQRAGVGVVAAAGGTVLRVRDGVADVSVKEAGSSAVAQQECGNGVVIDHGGGWETQYCHLARGSIRVRPGAEVASNEVIGRIGLSGLTEYPHLHFTVRHNGRVVDPFAPAPEASRCRAEAPLWSAQALRRMSYRTGAVLNWGFSTAPIDMEAVEERRIDPPGEDPPAIVAYVRAIGLDAGAVQTLTLQDGSGKSLARTRLAPLAKARAQQLLFVGTRRPASGWGQVSVEALYEVHVDGDVVLTKRFALDRTQ